MEEILSYCGFRCDLCPAYKENSSSSEHRQQVSDVWFKYFGFRVPPEQVNCSGCHAREGQIDSDCLVRPCAMEKKVSHCASCEGYICTNLETRLTPSREELTKEHGPVPEEDYQKYLAAFDNKARLAALRAKDGR